MYSPFQIATKYLHYLLTASNGKGHGIHSPFMYQLIDEVFNAKGNRDYYKDIEKIRKELLRNDQIIEVEDYGAGSCGINLKERKINDVARLSIKSPKYAHLLYQLVKFVKAKHILELGTSLGITTAYLSAANPKGEVITLEGATKIADLASSHFQKLNLQNIQLIRGNFDATLPALLQKSDKKYDLIYIDGNHTYEATVRYFTMLLPFTHEHTLIIFDDIHWSKGMEKAWQEIKSHHTVTLTIDLFFIGLVFLRRSQMVPQHFRIRF
ncbi:MAG: O-methyltransferase [Bacteroidota bacterium]